MSPTRDRTLHDPKTIITDLQRQLADVQRTLNQRTAERDEAQRRLAERTVERDEALDRQAATTEVLQIINSSPGDLAPVFDAMLDRALRLCDAAFGIFQSYDGENLRGVAFKGAPEALAEVIRRPRRPSRFATERLLRGEDYVQIADATLLPRSPESLGLQALIDLGGVRTMLNVPLLNEERLVGVLTAYRQEVRLFSDKQIALLQNFAAQAVIAMENARLLTETREALEQQTATAEVLQVINSSPGDLAPVFNSILEKAHRLCGAEIGSLQLYDGETLHAVATHAVPEEFADILRRGYRAAESPASRGLIEGEPFIQISDCAEIDHPVVRGAAELVGIRTLLVVPLRRDDAFLGLISAARLEVRPFSDKQIALLENFAAQAVIAMENARLLTETREALEQQTATAEVLQVINSSPGDLGPVFDSILEKSHILCGAAIGALVIRDGDVFRTVATHGLPEQFDKMLREPLPVDTKGGLHERLLLGESLIHIPDQAANEQTNPWSRASVEIARTRTLLAIALRKDDALLGYITASRQEVQPFSDKQITLLQNFAAQAVIAIENAAPDRDARGLGAADRDRRGIAGHQLLARRPRPGVRRHAGEGGTTL
jgi:GAF domain-containing protein